MSWQATAWVSTVEAGGPSGKLLLYALANYADEHGRCYPGDERIMRDTELSERAIRDWKRKLVEAGLIRVDRRRKPGGDFDLDVIVLAMDQPPANPAGGEDATTGKWCRDHRQMVPPPPANGAVPPTPPYIAEPSKEPPLEPVERESAGARAEEGLTKRAEALFWKSFKVWDRFDPSPKQPMLAAWGRLSWEEMLAAADAVPRYLAGCRASGMKHAPAVSKYLDLAERLWEAYPPVAEVEPTVVEGKPFGPWWMAERLRKLLAGPTMHPAGLTPFERTMVEMGKADADELMRQKIARTGYPAVNAMHDRAASRAGISVSARLRPLADGMEPVPTGSPTFAVWRREHDRRGWPWLPDTGDHPVVFFPKLEPMWHGIGPPDLAGLVRRAVERFEQAVRGTGDDGDRSEAA